MHPARYILYSVQNIIPAVVRHFDIAVVLVLQHERILEAGIPDPLTGVVNLNLIERKRDAEIYPSDDNEGADIA